MKSRIVVMLVSCRHCHERLKSSLQFDLLGGEMRKMLSLICAASLCLLMVINILGAETKQRVVIYDGVVSDVGAPAAALAATDANDLWITLAALKSATGFVLKPQGVCRDELCFPIPKGRSDAFLSKQGRITWFNLSEFARLLRQPAAHDAENNVWYFGPRPDVQNSFVSSLVAPDFTLPDMTGKMHSLRDF